jgi:stearoyl-CoA desaturase (delta-9 desaturase)
MTSLTQHPLPAQHPRELLRKGWTILRWFDSHASAQTAGTEDNVNEQHVNKVDWLRVIPFIAMHIACAGVIWVGWSPFALAVAAALYILRMLAITGFYHRYFSHKSFKTSRATQFVFALLGASAAQRGPLWWASHHRHHHIHSDRAEDVHSPKQHGFVWSHMGWFTSRENFAPKFDRIPDLMKFSELRWLDRFDVAVPVLLAVGLYALGVLLETIAPPLQTNGPQLLVWGFFISTVALYHATYLVNSLAHKFGKRRYKTKDDSRNSFLIALLTCGEGWHNNHHHYPGSARQGFYWWEIDLTYYFLRALAAMGLIWDLRMVPAERKRKRLVKAQITG